MARPRHRYRVGGAAAALLAMAIVGSTLPANAQRGRGVRAGPAASRLATANGRRSRHHVRFRPRSAVRSARARGPRGLAGYRLSSTSARRYLQQRLAVVEQPGGQRFYRTFRVTSESGLTRITNRNNPTRFMGGDGQYGTGFYLFAQLEDARRFVVAEAERGAPQRNVVVEVLLPAEQLEERLSLVPGFASWGFNYSGEHPRRAAIRELRSGADVLFGKWQATRNQMVRQRESQYEVLNGAAQLAVVNVGFHSVLQEAQFRRLSASEIALSETSN